MEIMMGYNPSIIATFMKVEIDKDSNFLVIKETLGRIGVPTSNSELLQSCHILHKKGSYYIVHYLELQALDGNNVVIAPVDILRRNTITKLLQDWGLCRIVRPDTHRFNVEEGLREIKVVPFGEKSNWNFTQNYTLGKIK